MGRFFRPDAWQHVYRITDDGGVLFYRIEDRLFYFTLYMSLARKHDIVVLGLCLMYTHVHEMVRAAYLKQLNAFERELSSTSTSVLVRDYGFLPAVSKLFKTPYGSASKITQKARRSSFIYLVNNPVEKHLVRYAIEFRWNFLAYRRSPNPFSAKLVKRKARYVMRMACRRVDFERKANRCLRPAFIRQLMTRLTEDEKAQLIDYIISRYNAIDYSQAEKMFGSFEKMCMAADSTTGSEYDVGESYEQGSDVAYREMLAIAEQKGLLGADMRLLKLPPSERNALIRLFKRKTCASDLQIQKLLHLSRKER